MTIHAKFAIMNKKNRLKNPEGNTNLKQSNTDL